MAEEYQIGKDMKEMEIKFTVELQKLQTMLEQLYTVVEYNLKQQNLDEPKPEEKKQ
jgi:hypothetical protein